MNANLARSAAPGKCGRPGVPVELHVGIEDVMERAFAQLPPVETINDPFEDKRRLHGRVKDIGAKGLVIECEPGDLGFFPIGSIVAFGFGRAPASDLGVVLRTISGSSSGKAWIGIRRLTTHARPRPIESHGARGGILFVPGADESGREDACLVESAAFDRGIPLQGYVSGCLYEFHLQRVHVRGPGWVLAGFEVSTVKPCLAFEPPEPQRRR